MAESPISSPDAPLGRGAVERSETERLFLQRPLIFCYLLFFSFRLFGLPVLTGVLACGHKLADIVAAADALAVGPAAS